MSTRHPPERAGALAPRAPVAADTLSSEVDPGSPVLDLQRQIGNSAVTHLLQRDAGFSFSPIAPKPPSLRPDMNDLMGDYVAASEAVKAWFTKTTQAAGNTTLLTIPELVAEARRLPFTGKDGKPHVVSEQLKVGDAETTLRVLAKARGVALVEHRDMADAKGVQSELAAVLENLGGLPSSLKLGGDKANLELHIAGKVTGELAIGGAKLKGEGSAEGGEATVELPGGTDIGVKGGPEGGGVSVKRPGWKAGVDATSKGAKAELKAGDLTIKGSVSKTEGGAEWSADIQFGQLGEFVTPAEIAMVMQGASATFGKTADAMAKGATDPKALLEHGGAVKEAVSSAVEKAKKSAAQHKPGWQIGATAKGSPAGGTSVMFTLTIVF